MELQQSANFVGEAALPSIAASQLSYSLAVRDHFTASAARLAMDHLRKSDF
jgi:hypothetical protein